MYSSSVKPAAVPEPASKRMEKPRLLLQFRTAVSETLASYSAGGWRVHRFLSLLTVLSLQSPSLWHLSVLRVVFIVLPHWGLF